MAFGVRAPSKDPRDYQVVVGRERLLAAGRRPLRPAAQYGPPAVWAACLVAAQVVDGTIGKILVVVGVAALVAHFALDRVRPAWALARSRPPEGRDGA